MAKEIFSRIIAGKYKNKKILLPQLEVTRSTKSVVKESFFNVLQFDIIDTIFIEAFGGSGSIGLEALSRGAKRAYFIEQDKNSYEILKENCKNIDNENSFKFSGDTFKLLPTIVNETLKNENNIVLYLDPPFDFRKGFDKIYHQTFEMIKKFQNDNIFLVAIEHRSGLKLPKQISLFKLSKSKKFGNTTVSYFI